MTHASGYVMSAECEVMRCEKCTERVDRRGSEIANANIPALRIVSRKISFSRNEIERVPPLSPSLSVLNSRNILLY